MRVTKRQAKVLELSKKLEPMSDSASKWARENIFKKIGYYAKSSGTIWCQCCGAQYVEAQPELAVSIGVGESWCPQCRTYLKLEHSPNRKHDYVNAHYTITTVLEGWQVLRTFHMQRENRRGLWAQYSMNEVFQNWIDEKGNRVILAKDYTRSAWHFAWTGTEMKPKKEWKSRGCGYYYFDDPFKVEGHQHWFYPSGKVTKMLRRDGWSAELTRTKLDIVEVMQYLLKGKPYVEELIKTKQVQVLQYWLNHGGNVADPSWWIASLRICNRRGYKITDADMWFDHLYMLQELGKDLHNAKYVAPANLVEEHAKLQKVKAKRDAEERRKRQEAEAKAFEAQYYKFRSKFFGLCLKADDLEIRPLQSVAEFLEEGTAMHHCVYSMGYYDHKRHPNALILSARDAEGNRIETVEVNLKNGTITQSRGRCNQNTPRHGEIMELVTNSMGLILKAAQTRKQQKISKAV